MSSDSLLAPFSRLLGRWTTEATHPAMPGVLVRGSAVVEWLEGEQFLLVRARTDHPEFPDSLVIIGDMSQDSAPAAHAAGGTPTGHGTPPSSLRMHYFDSRGVFRDYETRMTADAWEYWREAGFPQRFTGRLADGGRTLLGQSQLRGEDRRWADDLAITYRRADD